MTSVMETNTKEQYIHVPYGKAVWGEAEKQAVMHVLDTSTQMGKHVYEMEAKIATLFAICPIVILTSEPVMPNMGGRTVINTYA